MKWLDKLQDGAKFDGLTNKGFNYNGAWGGPAQDGKIIPQVRYSPNMGENKDAPYTARTDEPSLDKLRNIVKGTTDYYSQWMNSPRYNEIISNEISNPNVSDRLTKQRIQALNTQRNYLKISGENVGGYNLKTNQITEQMPLNKYIDTHEISHAQDYKNTDNFFSTGNIPQKSVDLISSLKRPYNPNYLDEKMAIAEKEFEEKKARGEKPDYINMTELSRDVPANEDVYNYLSKPTEVRARLNTVRQQLLDKGIMNPFMDKVSPEHMKAFEERVDEESYDQLNKVYNREDIQNLLNSVSYNSNSNSAPIAKTGSVITDEMGQWKYPGEITRIPSNDITMEGVPYPVLGISDTGDTKMMQPNKKYKFKGSSVTEYPQLKNGHELDDLLNFTNYNKKQTNWLDNL